MVRIYDEDINILDSVDGYMTRKMNIPLNTMAPQERVMIREDARNRFYSWIVQRVPRIAKEILSNDWENIDQLKALYYALYNHSLDPVFVNILMQHLDRFNNPEDRSVVGALLTKFMNKYIEDNWKKPEVPKTTSKKGDKDKTETPVQETKNDMSAVDHLRNAIEHLLGDVAKYVKAKCAFKDNDDVAALAIAACITMNSEATIREIIASDLPVTAELFKIIENPKRLVEASLNLKKADYTKLTSNQEMFIESLKKWVYDRLNVLPAATIFAILASVYGTKPDKDKMTGYLIQVKDCGIQYSNLLAVAKQLINQ